MTDTIKPVAYCSMNKHGDITSTIKHTDSWRNTPLYTKEAIEQARQEGREAGIEKLKGAEHKIGELQCDLSYYVSELYAAHKLIQELRIKCK